MAPQHMVGEGRKKRHRDVVSCSECHRRKQKCNRQQPCSNCVARGKKELCVYESTKYKNASNEVSADTEDFTTESTPGSEELRPSLRSGVPAGPDHIANSLGYSEFTEYNTLGLLRKLDIENQGRGSYAADPSKSHGPNQEYQNLVRGLPGTKYTDMLLSVFFSEVNFMYDMVEEIAFREHLRSWRGISYSLLQQDFRLLPIHMQHFPALLAQILAQALLYLPSDEFEELENMKYVPGMTFVNLATELSETGNRLLTVIGKKDITILAVQASLLKACFLKTIGSVVEAWHALGAAIRDAEEIGMHCDEAAEDNKLCSSSSQNKSIWNRELQRKIWLFLCLWDMHMAIILGRPILTTLQTDKFTFPRDLCAREQNHPPIERTEEHPPTPLSVYLIGYDAAYKYLPRIRDIENAGARLEDYGIVENIHGAITRNLQQLPAWCSLEDPDRKFDSLPGCYWLPAARNFLGGEAYIVILALHRPYVFSLAKSRTEALKATNVILRCQACLFEMSGPRKFTGFQLVFSSFDAIVLALLIFLFYPHENGHILNESLQNIEWGMRRLEKMGEYNPMAKSAHQVVLKLYLRLQDRHSSDFTGAQSVLPDQHVESNFVSESSPLNSLEKGFGEPFEWMQIWDDTPMASDLSIFMPPQPMHDLFFQDLSGELTGSDSF